MNFLIWLGGKSRMLNKIIPLIKTNNNEHKQCYIEPFIGGGSVLIKLLDNPIKYDAYICSDMNDKLIITYNQVKHNIEQLLTLLDELQSEYSTLTDMDKRKEFFYKLREQFVNEVNESNIAADFLILNRLCFRGLYHVNKSNQYDSPFGYNTCKILFNRELLIDLNQKFNLYNVHFFHSSYEHLYDNFKTICTDYLDNPYNITMYFDPPYYNTYDRYTVDGFNNIAFRDFIKYLKHEQLPGFNIDKFVISNTEDFLTLLDEDLFKNTLHLNVMESIYPNRKSKTRKDILLY